MFQIGQSGGLHGFGRYCSSARSHDTDRWSECDFPPTGAVQGMSPRDCKPKKCVQVCLPAWAVPIGCTWAGLKEPVLLKRMLHWFVGTLLSEIVVGSSTVHRVRVRMKLM